MRLVQTHNTAPTAAVGLVIEALRSEGALAPETIRNWTHVMGQFARYLERGLGLSDLTQVTPAVVESFLAAPRTDGTVPHPSVQRLRRCAVRCLFKTARQLGLADGDPSLDVEVPDWTGQQFRPLTDQEIELCRAAVAGTARPGPILAWALCEASARTGELPTITHSDLDLERRRVWIPGTKSSAARWGELTDWGVTQLGTHIGRRRSCAAPVLQHRSTERPLPAHTAAAWVSQTLQRAGFERSMGVRPMSIPAWVGRAVFDATGRIDLVASRCGVRSLDAAARLIAWDWQLPDG